MNSDKSCIRCASPLPADSASVLCAQCTASGKTAETPEQDRSESNLPAFPIAFPSKTVPASREIEIFSDSDDLMTDLAAAGHFVTGEATPDETPPKTEDGQIKVHGYSLIREIGRGGFGAVYEAVQLKTKRTVAIKILLGQTLIDRVRFDRETKALGKLKDPRVIDVYEAGVSDAGPYFCMERMTGGSLAQHLKANGPLEPTIAAKLTESIADGMASVHAAGLLHRDLKPGNILLNDKGNPKIADFGLAKAYEAGADETTAARISLTGGLLGTPGFMAPEQAGRRNNDVDVRTDVYSIGAILYQCLTGKVPFPEKNARRILDQVVNERPADPSSHRSGIPRELEAICLKCLEKDPEDRYQTAQLLADDLSAWQRGEETVAKPATRIQRASRWMKRQRKPATMATLVLATAAILNLAAMWIKPKPVPTPAEDPEAELKKIVEEIATGKEVILVPETGLPRYYPKKNNPVAFHGSGFSDGACTINSNNFSLFELLREQDLPEEFRFRAKVRNEQALYAASRCGLFIGKFEHTDNNNQKFLYFQRLAFADMLRGNPNQVDNFVMMNASCTRSTLGKLSDIGFSNSAKFKINNPINPGILEWRELEFTVTNKDYILATVKEDQKPPITRKLEKAKILKELQAANRLNFPDPVLQQRAVNSIFRGSIGLHVTEGIANFKDVTIQKITSD